MSLLARSIATLEGIALLGDPNYQMVAQAYPFVVRKVLRNSTASVGTLLRDIVFDASTGAVKPTRLSALLNAALGFVAERTDGFVDLDAVPEDGASLQVRRESRKKCTFFTSKSRFWALSSLFRALSCFFSLHVASSSVLCMPWMLRSEKSSLFSMDNFAFYTFSLTFPRFSPLSHSLGRRLLPFVARGEGPAPAARRGAGQRARPVGEGRPPEGLRLLAGSGSSFALYWHSAHAPASAVARPRPRARQLEGAGGPVGA